MLNKPQSFPTTFIQQEWPLLELCSKMCMCINLCECLCVSVSGVVQSALHSQVMSLKPPQPAKGRQKVSHQLLNHRKKNGVKRRWERGRQTETLRDACRKIREQRHWWERWMERDTEKTRHTKVEKIARCDS